MKVEEDDHLAITRVEECVLDVVVEHIDFVPTNGCVSESVAMSLQHSGEALLNDIRPNVEILEFGITLVRTDDQGVLFHEIRHFFLFGFASLVLLLNILDQSKGRV